MVTMRVEVYKNLRKQCYSIRQKGKVIGYALVLAMSNVDFVVQQGGRKRVLESGQKNVHAFLRGYIHLCDTDKSKFDLPYNLQSSIYDSFHSHPLDWLDFNYNPFVSDTFTVNDQPIHHANIAYMDRRIRKVKHENFNGSSLSHRRTGSLTCAK